MSAHLLIARSQLQLHNDEQQYRSNEEWSAPKKGIFRSALQATVLLIGKARQRLALYTNQVRYIKNAGKKAVPAQSEVRS